MNFRPFRLVLGNLSFSLYVNHIKFGKPFVKIVRKLIIFLVWFVQFQIWLIAVQLCTCTAETSAETDSSATPIATKLTAADAREKRTLSNFESNRNFHRQLYQSNGPIQRRIQTNFLPYPDAGSNYIDNYNGGGSPNIGSYDKDYSFDGYKQQQPQYQPQSYQPSYAVENSQYVGGYQQQQYIEAPEPIIEIIIKESNETLPAPAALQYQVPKKKKKEQVQVFYVKYNKDKEHGLVIDDPIPGRCPMNP